MKQPFDLFAALLASSVLLSTTYGFITPDNGISMNGNRSSLAVFRNLNSRRISRWSASNVIVTPAAAQIRSSPFLGGALRSSSDDGIDGSADSETTTTSPSSSSVNFLDICKYFIATGVQFAFLAAALKGIDKVVAGQFLQSKLNNGILPPPVVALLFIFLSLRSRVASVLDNSRPNREAMKGKATPTDIKRPSWTPPGIAFPFIWLSITALRGISSAMVYTKTGTLACPALICMILHLCIGDTWNTITNIEKRLGVSAFGVLFVWSSVWNAIVRYYNIVPLAGKILAPSGVWISIASVLTFSIWRINTPIQPLYPVCNDGKSAKWKFQNLGKLEATSIRGGK